MFAFISALNIREGKAVPCLDQVRGFLKVQLKQLAPLFALMAGSCSALL